MRWFVKRPSCANCRFEGRRIILFVCWITAFTIVASIFLISAFENEQMGADVLPGASAIGFVFLLAQLSLIFRCQAICARKLCRCGCHAMFKCRGKHHHWCNPDRDYSRLQIDADDCDSPDLEGDCCEHCVHRHYEDKFKIAQYDSEKYRCDCACHQKAWATPRVGICSCHRWCLKVGKVSA